MTLQKTFIIALAALSVAVPSASFAANHCEKEKHHNKVIGTLLGVAGGAMLGAAIGGHGHKEDGALVGAAGGAVVGNQMARSDKPCPDERTYREEIVTTAPPPLSPAPPPPPTYQHRAVYQSEPAYAPAYPAEYRRDEVRQAGYDPYGRYCTTETDSSYDAQGRYTTRQVQTCR